MNNMVFQSQVKILVYCFRGISNIGPSVRPIPLLTETCSYIHHLLSLLVHSTGLWMAVCHSHNLTQSVLGPHCIVLPHHAGHHRVTKQVVIVCLRTTVNCKPVRNMFKSNLKILFNCKEVEHTLTLHQYLK